MAERVGFEPTVLRGAESSVGSFLRVCSGWGCPGADSACTVQPRWITILVDANEEDQSAAHAIAHGLNPGRYDVVIYWRRYGCFDRNLPRLLAITTL